MKTILLMALLIVGFLGSPTACVAGGEYYQVVYPRSATTGELKLGVTYTLWVPEGVGRLQSVIVHQHGCGAPACQGGATAAYDLHWQALARKWNSALLGPSYHQSEQEDCQLWSNPANGSEAAFLQALNDLSIQTNHPELNRVPWCLWGHSGGGFWAGEMTLKYPQRIVAVWQRSGASGLFRPERAGLPEPTIAPEVFQVPVACNPGVKEQHDRFARIWTGMEAMFRFYRERGAPVVFAPDPRTSHECGDSRYLAIPFFDACLQMRLPNPGSETFELRPVDLQQSWFVSIPGTNPVSLAVFTGSLASASWLPNTSFAEKWREYVTTGYVSDTTPPPAPTQVKWKRQKDDSVEITWECEADFESGLGGFVIVRSGREIGRVPGQPVARFGRPLFQTMSYHDTPEAPIPQMRFVDTNAPPRGVRYKVYSLNSAGLRSP